MCASMLTPRKALPKAATMAATRMATTKATEKADAVVEFDEENGLLRLS